MQAILIYNTILLFAGIFAYLASYGKLNKAGVYFFQFLVFLTLFIPAAIRLDIGTDYANYEMYYKAGNVEYEPIFQFIFYICREFNLGFRGVVVITSFFTYLPIALILKRRGYFFVVVAYILMLYLGSYSVIRQCIATSFAVLALYNITIEEGTRFRSVIYILIAAGFHYSALLILPFLFIRIKPRFGPLSTIAILVVSYLLASEVIAWIFSSAFFLNSAYGTYVISDFNRSTELGSGVGVAIRLLLPICVLFSYEKYIAINKNYIILYWLNWAFIVSVFLSLNVFIFGRLTGTLEVGVVLYIAIFYLHQKKFTYSSLFMLVIILIRFVLFVKTINVSLSSLGSGLGINPYNSFLFH